jgi:3-oxoacyl-[acyl-carrier-protein] synthase II
VPVSITGSAVRTCFGDGPATFEAMCAGRSGVGPLRYADPERVKVRHGYHIDAEGPEAPTRAGRWLTDCVQDALAQAGVDPAGGRVLALVGTGLRELRAVERLACEDLAVAAERLHFGSVVAAAPTVTIANACSAGGHALALAQDLIELGDADAVVVGGTDAMTTSMLAMIGRVAAAPTTQVRPFDSRRTGVLLGDGAAALVVSRSEPALARLLGTGLSCDAWHETAPDADGIRRAMRDGLRRAGREPSDIDLVVAHGTGTELNDPVEAAAIRDVYAGCHPGPVVTAVKGAVGHTSGGSALLSVAMAVECLRTGIVPPIVGLRTPLPEAAGLRLAIAEPVHATPRTAQVDAFGFGGVNAVTLLEAVR